MQGIERESPAAFVAGATGYTGRHVVSEAKAIGWEVIAHIRPGSRSNEECAPHFEGIGAIIDRSPWDLEAMVEAMRQHRPDVVFCLIGTTRSRKKEVAKRGGDEEDASYDTVDYGLTALLVEACQKAECAPRFIYLSSLGVSPTALNAYMKARFKAEKEVKESGLEYTIARPGVITGDDRPESRPVERLSGALSDAVLKSLAALGAKEMERKYRSTTAGELARALVRLAADPHMANRVIEAQDLKEPVSLEEVSAPFP